MKTETIRKAIGLGVIAAIVVFVGDLLINGSAESWLTYVLSGLGAFGVGLYVLRKS